MTRPPASRSARLRSALGVALVLSAAPALGQDAGGLQVRPGFDASAPLPSEDADAIARMEQQLLDASIAISDPGERSRELERAARALLLSQNLDSALIAVRRAGDAAFEIPQGSLRDTRLDAASTTALALSEQLTQRAITGSRATIDSALPPDPNAPAPLTQDARLASLQNAIEAFRLAEQFAGQIRSANFRSAALSRAALSIAKKSQDVARFALESAGSGPLIDGLDSPFRDRADAFLAAGAETARRIPLPAWRDRTLVELVTLAAASHQYRRGLEIARSSVHTPSRAEALVALAQAQAVDRLDADATATYQDALETVTRIPLVGPRRTAATVLLDSLLATGRFDDARVAISIVPDPDLRLAALSAVARSMGARGLVDSAYRWIDAEAPPAFRDRLRREVADGLAEFVEQRQLRRSTINLREFS
jgi:hypothetical protein